MHRNALTPLLVAAGLIHVGSFGSLSATMVGVDPGVRAAAGVPDPGTGGAGAASVGFRIAELVGKSYGDADFDVTTYVVAPAGAEVRLESATPAICAVTEDTGVTILAAGECLIRGSAVGGGGGTDLIEGSAPVLRIPIGRAKLTITTYSIAKPFGETLTVDDFYWSIATVVGDDGITIGAFETAGGRATATAEGGPYVISAVLLDPNGRLGNYEVVENFGVVEVVHSSE